MWLAGWLSFTNYNWSPTFTVDWTLGTKHLVAAGRSACWFHLSHLFWTSSSVNLLQNWKLTQKLCFCHNSNHLEKLHMTHFFAMCNLYIYITMVWFCMLDSWFCLNWRRLSASDPHREWLPFCKMCADQPAKEWWLDPGSCLCQVRNGVDLLCTLLITAVSCFPIQLVFHDLNWLLRSVFCVLFFYFSLVFHDLNWLLRSVSCGDCFSLVFHDLNWLLGSVPCGDCFSLVFHDLNWLLHSVSCGDCFSLGLWWAMVMITTTLMATTTKPGHMQMEGEYISHLKWKPGWFCLQKKRRRRTKDGM